MPMRKVPIAVAAAVVAVGTWLVVGRDTGPDGVETAALVQGYCVDCHNPIDFAGSLTLDDKAADDVAHDAETWERVVRKVRTGMMPPAGEPRPDRATLDAFAAGLEGRLDTAAAEAPGHGPTVIRRLNRSEYANAIRDLLDLEIDAATLLPLDNSSEGFDNIATALGVSPSLVDSYVSSAMKISRWAVGDATATRTQAVIALPQDLAQDRHIDGLPIGTRGGARIEHVFPLDAEYQISVRRGFGRGGGGLDVTLDGVPIEVDGRGNIRLPVSAGPHALTIALIDARRSDGVENVYSAPVSTAGIQSIEIDGPIDPTGVGDTPSRRRIFSCMPASADQETDCAEVIVSALATRAFRRHLSREELGPLMDFYQAGRQSGGFESGIQQALARILVDPRFLYRIERDPGTAEPGTVHPIDDYELATRLAFFIWSSIPDDELLGLAASATLHEKSTLEAQVGRMLADPKAAALVENFAAQWLFLRELDSVTPDADAFNANLRTAMARESKLLFETIVREEMSILRLLDADFTFVDERLAEHYGFEGIRGSHFRRIELPADSPRRGLLGHASILTLTSVTNRTSPVIRGSWILETLLGSPAPVPPPDVETTLEGDNGELVTLSVRERLEAHRANPVCASCHAIMDPVGFSLENFDLIGAWRETDGGQPIDSSAVLVDGTTVDGPQSLRQALLDRSDAFVTSAAEKLMTYALGRRVEYYDMPTIRAIVRQAAAEDYRFSAFVLGVVESEPFLTRVSGGVD